MILVEHYIGVSPIHGVGIFSTKEIKRGTPIWNYHQNTTQVFWKKQYLAICMGLSLPALTEFVGHSHIRNGVIYYLNDNTKFINHCEDSNVAYRSDQIMVTVKNIKAGEEITLNYHQSFDQENFFSLNLHNETEADSAINKIKELLFSMRKTRKQFLINA